MLHIPSFLPSILPSPPHPQNPPRDAHMEKNKDPKDSDLVCSLCICRPPPLQLARLLEKVLAGMMTNKLAVPFLAPLLPGMEHFYPAPSSSFVLTDTSATTSSSTCSGTSSSSTCSGTSCSTAGEGEEGGGGDVAHLIGVLEKVRRLEYHSLEHFRMDLSGLRLRIRSIL